MSSNVYKYNSEANYSPGVKYSTNKVTNLTSHQIAISNKKSFNVKFPNILQTYRITNVKTDKTVKRWKTNPMVFWQNQVNFAIWCSTTGCGVSFKNHMMSSSPLQKSIFRFHVYYQIRRILAEMSCPIPSDQAFDEFDNGINRTAYERICNEFNISSKTDWRNIGNQNHQLGSMYYHTANTKSGINKLYALSSRHSYDDGIWTFKPDEMNHAHIDYIAQLPKTTYKIFILDNSNGLTRAGIERLNDSIRTYVWAILGSQGSTRTSILTPGTGFDAQKQFLADVEDAINSPVDLPSSIERYQNVLKYARSKIDYVLGYGLYMCPSDMGLIIGTITGYNNLIVIATDNLKLGTNVDINAPPTLSLPPEVPGGKVPGKVPVELSGELSVEPEPEVAELAQAPPASVQHEDNKQAVIVGVIIISAISSYLFSRWW